MFSLKTHIKNHKKIYYILKILKNINNNHFIDMVCSYGNNSNLIYIHHNGNLYPEKIIYYFKCGWSGSGFFGIYRMTLGALNYANQYNMLPVIEWDSSIPYYDKSFDSITTNPFEYYFKQPGNIPLKDAKKSTNLVIGTSSDTSFSKKTLKFSSELLYKWDNEHFKELANAAKRYIHLEDNTQKSILFELKNLGISDRTIGVHIHRLIFKDGIKDHPIVTELDEYIVGVEKLLSTGNYDKIYLATDESDTLLKFKEKFSNLIIYYDDVYRNKSGDTFLSQSKREKHHYRLGYEVLRDMYTLAKCKALVAGLSNVSFCAKITKLSFGEDYTDEIILDKGISKSKVTAKKFCKEKRGKI